MTAWAAVGRPCAAWALDPTGGEANTVTISAALCHEGIDASGFIDLFTPQECSSFLKMPDTLPCKHVMLWSAVLMETKRRSKSSVCRILCRKNRLPLLHHILVL